MNLLQFVEMDVASTLLLSAGCFLVVCSMSGLGSLFIKGRENLLLQAVLGLSFTACVALVAASLCAVAAKYVIVFCILVSVALTAWRVFKGTFPLRDVLQAFAPSLALYVLFVAIFMSYVFTHVGSVDYNCHMIYCSAIPEEIYKADYLSRIRIVDVYPYEWSKFHLFNGCMTAVPLAVFPFKNIVTFNLAKFATISVLAGAVFVGLERRYGMRRAVAIAAVALSVLYVGASSFMLWTLFINNYSSFLVMGALWLEMRDERYREAAVLAMVLALATSKSTVTGLLFFVCALYRLYRRYGGVRQLLAGERGAAVFCLAIGCGCACMLLTGASPAGEKLFNPDFLSNATSTGWVGSMFFAGPSLKSILIDRSLSGAGWDCLVFIFYAVVLVRHWRRVWDFLKGSKELVFYSFVLAAGAYLAYWINLNGGQFVMNKSLFIVPAQLICLYIIPLTCLFAACEESMYVPLRLFAVFAVVQFMILNADNGACNWCMIMLPLAVYIAEDVLAMSEGVSAKAALAVPIAMLAGTALFATTTDVYSMYVWKQSDSYHTTVELSEVGYLGDIPYEYRGSEDSSAVMLNSLKGNRIHYNVPVNQSDPVLGKLSMSMRFVPPVD